MLGLEQAEVATVLREGRLSLVPSAELVPGDIVEVAGTDLLTVRCMITFMRFHAWSHFCVWFSMGLAQIQG